MKTVLVYNPAELTATAAMVQRYNKHFADSSIEYIEKRIKECMEHFKDGEMEYAGTMGFIILAVDQEVEDDVTKVYLEFYFRTHLR